VVFFWLKMPSRRKLAKPSVGGLMLALWILTCAVTASPQLHALLHKESQSPDHYCLFTQLGQQSITTSSGVVLTPRPESLGNTLVRLEKFELLPSFDFVVSDGRAPPSVSLPTAVVG
jgi:hypothetical protein